MKNLILLVCLSFSFSVYGQSEHPGHVTTNAIMRQLNEIECRYVAVLPFNQRREAISKMDNLVDMINELIGNKAVFRNGAKQTDVMNNDTFDLFLKELKNAWPDDKKFKIYFKYFISYKLTVSQLTKISSLITFDQSKIETISLLYPIVIDKENSMELINCVNDKSSLIKALK